MSRSNREAKFQMPVPVTRKKPSPARYKGSHGDIVGRKPKGIQGRVINSLGESIVRGLYPQGSLLPRESELMRSFDASRTSIREVIKVLSAKGLVETRQKIGRRGRNERRPRRRRRSRHRHAEGPREGCREIRRDQSDVDQVSPA